jgi:hypothetical protein
VLPFIKGCFQNQTSGMTVQMHLSNSSSAPRNCVLQPQHLLLLQCFPACWFFYINH